MQTQLGKLEKVQIRTVWKTEDNDFTPWLAKDENIALLSEELNIQIEIVRQEQWVGNFKADILANEVGSDHTIIIENQFGKTDHSHLGQLITYASGLKATTVIWISEKFTEEHRAAIDWINEVSNENISFFGIEIELYKIGDSEPAPMFNVVSKPNNWSKIIQRKSTEGTFTDTKLLQLEYWEKLKEYVETQKRPFQMQKPLPHHWTSITLGRSYFHINAIVNTRNKSLIVQLVISGNSGLENFRKLKELYEQDSRQKLSENIEWLEKDGKEHHVNLLFSNEDPSNKSEWSKQQKLLTEWIGKFHTYFRDKIKSI